MKAKLPFNDPNNNKKERLRSFDFLRGLAILGVVSVHTTQNFTSNIAYIDYIFNLGRFGVQLFYFISALTMCYMWQLRKNEKNKIRNFYIRRFFRIVPLFWIAVFAYTYKQELELTQLQHQIFLSATLLHGLSSKAINFVPGGWSIFVEACFYLIFPFLIIKIGNRKNIYLFLAVTIWAGYTFFLKDFLFDKLLTLDLISNTYKRNEFLYMTFLNQSPIFFLGCYMFFVLNNLKTSNAKILFFFILWIIFNTFLYFFYEEGQYIFSSIYIFLGLFCFFCILKNIKFRPIEIIGKYSYAIYLFHNVVIDELLKVFVDQRNLFI
ncbi:acyltransferase [Pseudomonadota bacterium]|nr:acyltransferase [Pseudomonadota bacterium]